MSDSDSEKDNEGEEEEEGGEEEKSIEEEPPKEEEVKAPEPPARYYPKISPLTQCLNINRDLDMLNSEVNLMSSQYMMTMANGRAPNFTSAAPGVPQSTGMYTIPQQSYTSPVRDTTQQPGYWNNPNHIQLSPKYNQSFYNMPEKPMYSSQPQFQNQMAPAPNYSNMNQFSPSRTQFGASNNYAPNVGGLGMGGYPTNHAAMGMDNSMNMNGLMNNINQVLGGGASPVPQPPSYGMPPQPMYGATQPSYNTFDRGSTFTPNFNSRMPYERSPHRFPAEIDAQRPPLYQRPRSVNNRQSPARDHYESQPRLDYNRKPLKESHVQLNMNHHEPQRTNHFAGVQRGYDEMPSPSRQMGYDYNRSPQRHSPRATNAFTRPRSVNRQLPEHDIRDAAHTLFR